jgi:hypothetical protein
VKEPTPPSQTQSSLGIGSPTTEALGHFRWNTFYPKMLRANKAKDRFAMLTAYFETARAIMVHYPGLKLWERQHQYSCFKSEMELRRLRAGKRSDFTDALPAIAMALNLGGHPASTNLHHS